MNTHYITPWIDSKEAAALRKQLIAEGKYTCQQLKQSNKFTNGKDKTDGYLGRLRVVGADAPVKPVTCRPAVKPAEPEPVAVPEPEPEPVVLNVEHAEETRNIGGTEYTGRKVSDASGNYYEATWTLKH